ncbi:MAG: MBL fold metallo-hydrolase [Phycisphaerales bacterium]|nr:MAG: MBL fold metallo-hydrolase [Phycisphaerales bacterium]
MQTIEYRIISIGTLAAHPLWNEKGEVRTGHPTTTLISSGETHILVNPGLPAAILGARMGERTNVRPDQITHVFLTALSQDHYRALPAFEKAEWYAYETEGIAALAGLRDQLQRAEEGGDEGLIETVRNHMEIIRRCRAAEDSLVQGVDLFPLPGVTPGTCGLLLALPRQTVLIAGDAVATLEHLQQGKVLPHSASIEQAQDSFREAIEIADIIIPGRDNLVFNPLRVM